MHSDRLTRGGSSPLGRSIAIMIIEDHLAVRRGLELLLSSHGHHVVCATHSPEPVMQLLTACSPDVALVDIDHNLASAIGLVRRLLSERPGLGVLFYYSGREEPEMLADALACGARGFALKTGPPEELLDAITAVAEGYTWLDPQLPRLLGRQVDDDPTQRLSPREREVLDLLAGGATGQEVARQLFLSPETIRTHIRNAMRKLDARTRSQAIAMVVRAGSEPAFTAYPPRGRFARAEAAVEPSAIP